MSGCERQSAAVPLTRPSAEEKGKEVWCRLFSKDDKKTILHVVIIDFLRQVRLSFNRSSTHYIFQDIQVKDLSKTTKEMTA